MDTIELEPKHIPVAGSADVVVAGGGPAGVCAAIAAATVNAGPCWKRSAASTCADRNICASIRKRAVPPDLPRPAQPRVRR